MPLNGNIIKELEKSVRYINLICRKYAKPLFFSMGLLSIMTFICILLKFHNCSENIQNIGLVSMVTIFKIELLTDILRIGTKILLFVNIIKKMHHVLSILK